MSWKVFMLVWLLFCIAGAYSVHQAPEAAGTQLDNYSLYR